MKTGRGQLVERLAQHLWTDGPNSDQHHEPWEKITGALRDDWRDLARAALDFLIPNGPAL